ncbi:hypothetical protein [Vreelandella alkaliphila]|uniref:Asparagine synthetase domain-containing protein n=1 Tax=Vreelandella alkaliphila TaxID=272774 RepID=A0AAJ2RZM1_9GAMM|nr:hypothetical protein [Halomonas alkaliphila]MDX5976685.1 hypothetical protein [Halomonas alkaliphila]
MSVYISIFSKKDKPLPEYNDFLPYVFDSDKANFCYVANKRSLIYVWQWGSVIDNSIVEDVSGQLFVQGLSNPQVKKYLFEILTGADQKIDHEKIGFPLSSVFLNEKFLSGYASFGVLELSYYVETEDYFAISNRVGLLACLSSPSLNAEGLAKLIGKGHMIDSSTVFHGIKKLMPGQHILYHYEQGFDLKDPDYSEVFSNLEVEEAIALVDEGLNDYKSIMESEFPKSLNLSGGKDSRAVLAMLNYYSSIDKNLSLRTTGSSYSPEVLAAKEVIRSLGEQRCKWNNVSSFNKPVPESGGLIRKIAQTLNANEGLASFWGWRKFTRSNVASFGGHEVSFKYPVNKLEKKYFLEGHKNYIDPNKVITPDYFDDIFYKYKKNMTSVLDTIPEAKYSAYHVAFNRTPCAQATLGSMMQNIGGCQINPLMNYKFSRALSGISHRFIDSEFMLFYLMYKGDKKLPYLPFCNDNWSKKLPEVLSSNGFEYSHDLLSSLPYFFDSALPEHKFVGHTSEREEFFTLVKKILPGILSDQRESLDFLNYRLVGEWLKTPYEKMPRSVASSLSSVFSVALILTFKNDFLRYDKVNKVEEEIGGMLSSDLGKVDKESVYLDRIRACTESITQLVNQKRALADPDLEFKIADSAVLLNQDKPWHANVNGEVGKNVRIKGVIARSPQTKDKVSVRLSFFDQEGNSIKLQGFSWHNRLECYTMGLLKRDGGKAFDLVFNIEEKPVIKSVKIFCLDTAYIINEPCVIFE